MFGLSNIGSAIYNNMPSFSSLKDFAGKAAGYAAPLVGSAIGNYFGGQKGADFGRTAGSMFGNFVSGNQSAGSVGQNLQSMNDMGQRAANFGREQLNSRLSGVLGSGLANTAMNTRLQDMGPTLGRELGQQYGQQFGGSIPFVGGYAGSLGGKIGERIGSLGQNVANRFMPNYLSQSTPNQMIGMGVNQAQSAMFNALPKATQNLAGFHELPFAGDYARGGYVNGGYAQQPYGYPGYAIGGYTGGNNSYYNPGFGGEYAVSNMPSYRPSLQELAEMMPVAS